MMTVISICLTLAVFRNVFSVHRASEIENIRQTVRTHESILADNEKVLRGTRLALEAVQRDLAAIKVSGKH